MDQKIRLLIADDIEDTRDLIKQLIALSSETIEVVAEASNGLRAVELAEQYKPDLILMDINMPELNGLEATARIIKAVPNSIVIIMSVQSETEYLKQAMFSGAKEYIIKPFDSDTLMGTLIKTYERYHQDEVLLPAQSTGNQSKLWGFFSTKGGVGKTFLALNTALCQSVLMKKKTLLVDLDLQFGDIALMIDKPNAKTVYDCINDVNYQQFEDVEPYLVHYSPELDILLAPKSPEEAEYLQQDIVEGLLKLVRNHYEIIIVDMPISFSELMLSVLDSCQQIVYVTSIDLLSLKNTRTGLGVMKSLNYSEEKIKVVVNKRNESFGIKMGDVEKLYGKKPFSSLVNDEKGASLSVNMGIPFVTNPKNKGSKLYKELIELNQKLLKE